MEVSEQLKPYVFHGVELEEKGGQGQGICPFCEGKFFVSVETGQFDCKNCMEFGNKYTFLTKYHKLLLSIFQDRIPEDLKRIRKLRGNVFPTAFLKDHGLLMDGDEVVFPVRSPGAENLTNLRRWSSRNKRFYNTPTCCSLYTAQWSDEGSVYICEGEWDALALKYLRMRAKEESECAILAVPGAGVFKDSWVEKLKGRNVFLLYDNDHDRENKQGQVFNPAADGMRKAVNKLAGTANSVSCIDWSKIDSDLPDGYDIRDHLAQAVKARKSKKYLRNLISACVPSCPQKGSGAKIKTLKRTSFSQVVEDWKSVYEFNQSFEDVLACCFATLVSLFLTDRRDPLWMFIVAPASSGKTTIIEGFKEAVDQTIYLSELTPAALVTGLKCEGEDPSLLNRGNNKVWFVEDFTPILQMAGRDEVFGIFRSAYTGFYDAHFATQHKEYTDLHFSVIAGVTHAIERFDLADLGERFIRIRLLDKDFDEDAHIRRALNNVGVREDQKKILLGGVNGFIEHMLKNKKEPVYDPAINDKLIELAKFAALMRTPVHRSKGGDLSTRPVAEVASRIATQLKKLGIGLSVVYNRPTVDEECYRVMQKVALDTCAGWNLELVQTIRKAPGGMLLKDIAEDMNLHINQVRKITEAAQMLNVVRSRQVKPKGGGRPTTKYLLSRKVKNMIAKGGISGAMVRKHSNRTKRTNDG